jgi:hypothetical protein
MLHVPFVMWPESWLMVAFCTISGKSRSLLYVLVLVPTRMRLMTELSLVPGPSRESFYDSISLVCLGLYFHVHERLLSLVYVVCLCLCATNDKRTPFSVLSGFAVVRVRIVRVGLWLWPVDRLLLLPSSCPFGSVICLGVV